MLYNNDAKLKMSVVMLRKIVVPLDGSELAERALPYAQALAQKFDARLILLWVVQSMPPVFPAPEFGMVPFEYDEFAETVAKRAEDYLGRLRQALLEQKVPTDMSVLRSHSVADAIVDFAEQEGVDLIVKTTHGRSGISRWVFGSVATKVLAQAPCPVFLVRVSEESR